MTDQNFPGGITLTTRLDPRLSSDKVAEFIIQLSRLMSADTPPLEPVTPTTPLMMLLTMVVGSFVQQDVVASAIMGFFAAIGKPNDQGVVSTFEYHYPTAPDGKQWTTEPKPVEEAYWKKLTLPFQCFSQTKMERFIAIFDSEWDTTPTFRTVSYPMNVTQISLSGLRFKVNNVPEMWVLAYQTQEKAT